METEIQTERSTPNLIFCGRFLSAHMGKDVHLSLLFPFLFSEYFSHLSKGLFDKTCLGPRQWGRY